ncbi:MAG: hypothetical protein JEZ04_08985 [Spirochaetales bacterium]|nr:hypothetical protein [Spirochaetales bacterium]
MTRIFLYSILILICTAILFGCHFEVLNPNNTYQGEDEPSETEGGLDVTVITESGDNLAYRSEELLISISPSEITGSVSIVLVDKRGGETTLIDNYSGPFPFSWIIPEDFPPGESYRILVRGKYYKNDSGIFGFSEEFAILTDFVSGLSDITVSSRIIEITLTDNGSVIDDDTISISLNGSVLDAKHILAGSPGTSLTLYLQEGTNTLSITAVNEGSVSPNTAEITFTDVTEGEVVQEWRLLEGETGTLSISAP